jgi:quercetin dioxygenase-like cupin family protein
VPQTEAKREKARPQMARYLASRRRFRPRSVCETGVDSSRRRYNASAEVRMKRDARPAAEPAVKRADAVPSKEVTAGRATRSQVLVGPGDGAPNFALRRFRMETGGGMPLHTNTVEHEQFVLRGRAEIRLGEETHSVEAGCVLFIPAGVPHAYRVVEGPFEFLCIVPNAPDHIEVLD